MTEKTMLMEGAMFTKKTTLTESLDQQLFWSKKYNRIEKEEGLLLSGEKEQFFLDREKEGDLIQKLIQPRTYSELLSGEQGLYQEINLFQSVQNYQEKGVLEKFPNPQTEYLQINWQSNFQTIPLEKTNHHLFLLSCFQEHNLLLSWAQKIAAELSVDLVIVDDYLDPRLEGINQNQLQQKRDWLLLKPTGEQPFLGPLFSPKKENYPCWKCLATRLLHNQPMRFWLRENHQDWTVPILHDHRQVQQFLTRAAKWIKNLEGMKSLERGEKLRDLLELNAKKGIEKLHPVNHLPQCSQCGKNGKSGRNRSDSSLLHQPIVLKSSLKIVTQDGGARCYTPEETLAKLQRSLSPLTGVISETREVSGQNQKGILIYESSFFKTPPLDRFPSNQDLVQKSLGKGVSLEQSQVGALAESIERFAVQYKGDEPRLYRSLKKLEEEGQSVISFATHKESRDIPTHWTSAWSLTSQKHTYLPLNYCYANTPFTEENFCHFNSNGCSAGNNLEEAILQGFLELIERDATAVWWYNRVKRRGVDFNILSEQCRSKVEQSLSGEWDYWMLDLTHDFQIPVIVAVAQNKQDRSYRLGFGCHLNLGLACQRALTELCQLIAIRFRDSPLFDFSQIQSHPFLHPMEEKKQVSNIEQQPHVFSPVDPLDLKQSILECMKRVEEKDMEFLVLEYPRPDLPLKTVKVVVPGLNHIWPPLRNPRLSQVPVTLGWRKTPLLECELNAQNLMI